MASFAADSASRVASRLAGVKWLIEQDGQVYCLYSYISTGLVNGSMLHLLLGNCIVASN